MKKPRLRYPMLDLGGFILDQSRAARLFRKSTEDVEIVHHDLPLAQLKAPLRLVHLTDFHASRSVRFPFLESAMELALSLKPDLICLTGDYTSKGLADWTPLTRLLRSLQDAAPTFAVLGNHDGWPEKNDPVYAETRNCLKLAGISLLENRHTTFEKAGARLQIVGTGDFLRGPFDPETAFAGCDPTLATVLLSHNPDARANLLPFRWDLCLCGHTHGGQINLPGLHGRFTPLADRRYQCGIFQVEKRHLHVNRGIGAIGGVRFRARPEICVFDLRGPVSPPK